MSDPAPDPAAPAPEAAAVPKIVCGIDKNNTLCLIVPLDKADHITARGLCDYARTQMLEWYAKREMVRHELKNGVTQGAVKAAASKIRSILTR